jgi:hypothetical protein
MNILQHKFCRKHNYEPILLLLLFSSINIVKATIKHILSSSSSYSNSYNGTQNTVFLVVGMIVIYGMIVKLPWSAKDDVRNIH